MEYLLRLLECRMAVFAVGFTLGGGLGFLAALDWLRSIRKDEEHSMSKAYSEVPTGHHVGGVHARTMPVSQEARGPATRAEIRRRIEYWERRKVEVADDPRIVATCERAIERLKAKLDQATSEGMG